MPAYNFLEGGGEMGELTRQFNWHGTSLGTPDTWPQSLKTTLSIILNSKFPMFLFWGAESLCFYNDAYRPSLGKDGKHPGILGQPGAEAWPEIWEFIKPLINQVLAGGEASWNEDQLLPIYRNGKIEDVYWTFSYSPVRDETGNPAGVFVTCTETTDKIIAIKDIQNSKEDLDFALNAADLGTFDLDPATNKFKGNTRLKEWFGLTPDEEIPLPVAINSIAEKDRIRVSAAIQRAMQYESGGHYDIEYTIINPKTNKERLVRAVGKALFNDENIASRFSGTLQDITVETNARKAFEDTFQRLEIALDAGKLGSYDLNLETGLMMCSYQCKLNYGWPPDKPFNYSDLMTVIDPDYRDYVQTQVNTAITEHVIYNAEYPISWPDGSRHWVSVSGKPRYDDKGEIAGMIGVTEDITEIKQYQRELQTSEANLRMAIDTARIGTWNADLITDMLSISEHAYTIHGIDPGHRFTLAQSLHMITPGYRDKVKRAIEEAVRTGDSFEIEYCIEPMDKSGLRWLRSTGKAYYNDNGQPVSIGGTIYDITESKQDEQRKNDFIGMVSHELKTPLTSLKGYVQILHAKAKKQEDSFAVNALSKVETQVNKMSTMINSFLNVSRLESGKINLDKEEFDLYNLLKDTVEETMLINPSHQISLTPCGPIMVYADKDKVEHVVSNLLSNAVKYSPRGSTIIVKCKTTGNAAEISVQDKGIGIKPNDAEHLFERYYRVESNESKHISGFGIGLYLSSEIIQRHGGKIWVESEFDNGSTFYFSLPLNSETA